jgi:tetratricopeptide (TPR) repeat protein
MNAQEYFERGWAFYQERDYEPAIKNFEAALKLNPNNVQLRDMIEQVKLCAVEKAKGDYHRSQAEMYERMSDSYDEDW